MKYPPSREDFLESSHPDGYSFSYATSSIQLCAILFQRSPNHILYQFVKALCGFCCSLAVTVFFGHAAPTFFRYRAMRSFCSAIVLDGFSSPILLEIDLV